MRTLKRPWWAVLAMVLGLALVGCGDSNLFDSQSDSSGRQADLEAGRKALDDGDWQAARDIFQAMDPANQDPEVAKYKASTYLAEAGFDSITLLRELAKASDSADSGQVLYDSLTRMFDEDGDGLLTAADAGSRLTAISGALEVLGASLPAGPGRAAASLADDAATFQTGLYAAVYAVVSVVQQLEYPVGSGNLLLSIDSLRQAADNDPNGLPIGALDGTGAGVTVPAQFNQALGLVRDAIFVIDPTVFSGSETADSSEIANAMDDFLTDIGYLPNESVDAHELRTYLNNLIQ